MKNIKRFEIDVTTAFGGEDYDDVYPLQIVDLNTDYPSAKDGSEIAEIVVNGDGGGVASFRVGLEEIESLFDVLSHIRAKVLEQKKADDTDKNEQLEKKGF